MAPPVEDKGANLILPEMLQAPHLRHLVLSNFALSIGSRLLTTAVGLDTLGLLMNSSTYFRPLAGRNPLEQNIWQMFCSNEFLPCPSWRLLCSVFTSLFPNPVMRGIACRSCHLLTFATFGSKVLALTWKRSWVGSSPLASCPYSPLVSRIMIPTIPYDDSATYARNLIALRVRTNKYVSP